MAKNVLTGARALIYFGKTPVGLFTNCSWSVRQGKEPLFILGRYNPAEIVSTTQEAVSLTLTGYRVIEEGPYAKLNVKMLKELLHDADGFGIQIVDRQSGKTIFKAEGCKVSGWSSGVASRGISDIRLDVVGLLAYDEKGVANGGDEDPGAADLP